MSRPPAALAHGLIRRGCSPANLANARYAMAAAQELQLACSVSYNSFSEVTGAQYRAS
eukprot:COSAG06_NODE_679_length_13142_cov_15.143832_7_plen_58_part_00